MHTVPVIRERTADELVALFRTTSLWFSATEAGTFGVAKMFAALMEPSPIDVAVFIDLEAAALWLGVPEEALQAEE